MTSSRRRVVLHFDLNRTVLMSDAAGGRSMENTVNYLLSECSWGYASPEAPGGWACVSEASSVAPPAHERALLSYKQFVDDAHPYRSLAGAQAGDLAHVKAFNKQAKKQRTALQSAFTGAADAPGRRVRGSFDHVMRELHFPAGEQRDAAQKLAAELPASRLQEAWRDGRYYLLPSFLRFLGFLASPAVTEQLALDVTLVFRTFGDDIVEVARELALLVDGRHPTGLPALPERFRLELEPSKRRVGTFYRDGFGPDGTALAVGTLAKVPFSSQLQAQGARAPDEFYAATDAHVDVVRGFRRIHETLRAMTAQASTLALRDYWEWWSAHAEDGQYGKLLLLEAGQGDGQGQGVGELAAFFDDHIEAHHAHIVDARDVATGEPLAFERTRGTHLLRVEPFAAITQPDYFTTLFHELLAAN